MTPSRPPARTEELSALFAQAQAHRQGGDIDAAIGVLDRLLALRPHDADALTLQGWLLGCRGRPHDAIARHRAALQLAPRNGGAWSNLAIVLQDVGQHDEALAALQQAIALAPQLAEAHVNFGIALLRRGMPGESIAAQRRALQCEPELAEAWINLGLAYQDCGDLAACISAYREALRVAPGDLRVVSNLQMALQYHPAPSPGELRDAAIRAGSAFPSPQPLPPRAPSSAGRRLRIGYVSADLYRHPVASMAARALLAHDRKRVEVHCFADQRIADDLTMRLRAGIEHWHETQMMTDAALCEFIRALEIDVLVDLAGHTAQNRLGVFARRAAPAQAAWLGYTASTGLPAMDAVLLGPHQATAAAFTAYSERVVALERCPFGFMPPEYAPEPMPPPSAARGTICFGSFNTPAKLNDRVVHTWATILRAVPDSRLLLKSRPFADPRIGALVRQRFALNGIAPERIECRGASVHPEMLMQYGEMDVALDPFPFCGGLTTCEALWMGVPVVSLPWQRAISRQGEEILRAVGLDDLVAETPAEYVHKAIELAADIERRRDLRVGLRQRMAASPLFDGEGLARALETAYFELARPEANAEPM